MSDMGSAPMNLSPAVMASMEAASLRRSASSSTWSPGRMSDASIMFLTPSIMSAMS